MKTKIEIGSFARRKSDGKIVKVALAKYGWIAYDENVLTAKSCPMEELEPCDPKTAFLTRLQELLATFDASIEAAGEGTDSATIDIYFNNKNKQLIYSEDWNDNEFICKITAENIVNYDKD